MREYRFQATDDTVEALRRLRAAWRGMSIAEHAVTIVLGDGFAVRIDVDAAEVEDVFDAYRLRATLEVAPGVFGVPIPEFADGGNDVVLFTGVTWSEPEGAVRAEALTGGSAMHFSGHPGQLTDSAEIVCITTDAFVCATAQGTGMLVRTGLKPMTVDVERDPDKVRTFLLDRGYGYESS